MAVVRSGGSMLVNGKWEAADIGSGLLDTVQKISGFQTELAALSGLALVPLGYLACACA